MYRDEPNLTKKAKKESYIIMKRYSLHTTDRRLFFVLRQEKHMTPWPCEVSVHGGHGNRYGTTTYPLSRAGG